jgi:hypothetical protein
VGLEDPQPSVANKDGLETAVLKEIAKGNWWARRAGKLRS